MNKLSGALTFLPDYTASHHSRRGFVDAGVRASNFQLCPFYDKLIEKCCELIRMVCQGVMLCGGVWCVVCSWCSWPGRLNRQYKSDKFWERTRTKTKTPFRYEAHLFTQAVRSIRVCHCFQYSPSLCCGGQGCHCGPPRNCTLHAGPAEPFGNILPHQTLTYCSVLPSVTSKFVC